MQVQNSVAAPPAPPRDFGRGAFAVVKLAFFLSGMAALFYQIIWVRLLSTFFGNTTLALALCLTAFMSGLALGSYAFGRWTAAYGRPFRLYAILEVAIGLYGILSPHLISAVRAAYLALAADRPLDSPSLAAFQFVSCLLVLLLPTALMGGTLPILVRGVVRRLDETGRDLAWLYGINTFGAAAGALLVGFFLLPTIGLRHSLFLAAALNVAAGLSVFLLKQSAPASVSEPSDQAPSGSPTEEVTPLLRTLLIVGFALSGFAGLALEVLWGRSLVLHVGTSVYAFSAVLFSVLVGLALGSILIARLATRFRITLRWFAEIEIMAGLSTLLLAFAYNYLLPVFGLVLQRLQTIYPLLVAVQLLVILLFLLVPTLLAGASFPVLARLCVRDGRSLSRHVGALYAANTGGCILGAALTGYVLIPHVGLHASVLLCAGLYVLVGSAILLAARGAGRRLAVAALAVFALGAVLLPDWRHDVMSAGLFQGLGPNEMLDVSEFKLTYYREGPVCTVSVVDWEGGPIKGVRSLKVNGKVDASTEGDVPTQVMSAHLPMLLADRVDRVLVVGLGSGASAGAATLHPDARRVDCVEIEPAVGEAAHYFPGVNHNVFSDPRFHLIIADGRNYLAASRQKYDVITNEPSNPWIAGVGSLFTVEHFQACREALADDGVICQWLQFYSMDPEDVASVIASFTKVFPDTVLWAAENSCSDVMLVARKHPWKPDYAAVEARLRTRPRVAASLREAQIPDALHLFSLVLRGPQDLRQLCRRAVLNTDDLPLLEFRAPTHLYTEDTQFSNILFLSQVTPQPLDTFMNFGPRDARAREQLADHLLGAFPFSVHFDTRHLPGVTWFRTELQQAVKLDPTRDVLYEKLARADYYAHDYKAAQQHAEQALRLSQTEAMRPSLADLFEKLRRVERRAMKRG